MANINVRVRGNRQMNSTFKRVARGRGLLPEKLWLEAFKPFTDRIERRGFGFTDRTGTLRGSLTKEYSRTPKTKALTGIKVIATATYAAVVERRHRSNDTRRGPPYWFGRAIQLSRKKIARNLARATERQLAKTAKRKVTS